MLGVARHRISDSTWIPAGTYITYTNSGSFVDYATTANPYVALTMDPIPPGYYTGILNGTGTMGGFAIAMRPSAQTKSGPMYTNYYDIERGLGLYDTRYQDKYDVLLPEPYNSASIFSDSLAYGGGYNGVNHMNYLTPYTYTNQTFSFQIALTTTYYWIIHHANSPPPYPRTISWDITLQIRQDS